MKSLIIDASVAIKWFIPEEGSDAATRFFSKRYQMLAPDLITSEIGNIIWKIQRRGLLNTEEAYQVMDDFLSMPIEIYDSQHLINSALEIAIETGRTVYDSVYLALAIRIGGIMVTADKRLVNGLENTQWQPFVKLLE